MNQGKYYWNYRKAVLFESIELYLGDIRIGNFSVKRDKQNKLIPGGLFYDSRYTNFHEIYDKVQSIDGLTEGDREELLRIKENLILVEGFIPHQTSNVWYFYAEDIEEGKKRVKELRKHTNGRLLDTIVPEFFNELTGINFDGKYYDNREESTD